MWKRLEKIDIFLKYFSIYQNKNDMKCVLKIVRENSLWEIWVREAFESFCMKSFKYFCRISCHQPLYSFDVFLYTTLFKTPKKKKMFKTNFTIENLVLKWRMFLFGSHPIALLTLKPEALLESLMHENIYTFSTKKKKC